jgi:hypothetical protein
LTIADIERVIKGNYRVNIPQRCIKM